MQYLLVDNENCQQNNINITEQIFYFLLGKRITHLGQVKQNKCNLYNIFNRPGVAGAVVQKPLMN